MLPDDGAGLAGDQLPDWMRGPVAPRMKPPLCIPFMPPSEHSPAHPLSLLHPTRGEPHPRLPGAHPGGLADPVLLAALSPLTMADHGSTRKAGAQW